MSCCMIETLSVLSRKSSVIFGNLRQSSQNVRRMLGNVRLAFGTILENLRKSSESDRKSSENRQKRRHKYVCIKKQNITWPLVDTNEFYLLVFNSISS